MKSKKPSPERDGFDRAIKDLLKTQIVTQNSNR